ncbi:hypothetical protein AAG570_004572 [Ranatra chinensis]|uniref:Nuclear pore complex protein Nup153 n=1 Tax=Ranatra chinensis TaxID=642074 RepID=A0ABD0Y1B9_9HEMI
MPTSYEIGRSDQSAEARIGKSQRERYRVGQCVPPFLTLPPLSESWLGLWGVRHPDRNDEVIKPAYCFVGYAVSTIMAKGDSSGRPKRTNAYRPYDASNSFVKRVTNRVSELLPQPSSWISRWLSPSTSSSSSSSTTVQPPTLPHQSLRFYKREQDDEAAVIDGDEELRPQQVFKRIRLSNSTGSNTTTSNDFTLPNNLRQLDSLRTTHEEEISPILRNHEDEDCRAVAGPSGLQMRRKDRFAVSTPAVQPPPQLLRQMPQPALDKVNGDDGSDSSDSTSGCSSLVPQADKISSTGFSSRRTLQRKSDSLNISSSSRNPRHLFSKPKYPRVELPSTPGSGSSKGAVPTFDSLVFNSANKTRLGHNSSLREDASPFYSGRTMYGGASSSPRNSSRNLVSSSVSLLFPGTTPTPTTRVIDIKPSVRPEPSNVALGGDTMGTTARKILDALEKFSTPVLDAKRIPVRPPGQESVINPRSVKKRKIQPHPFQELSIPQMPDLLRIKRREAVTAVNKQSVGRESSSVSSVTPVPSTPTPIGEINTPVTPCTSFSMVPPSSTMVTSGVPTTSQPTPVTTMPTFGNHQKHFDQSSTLRKDKGISSSQKAPSGIRLRRDKLSDEPPPPRFDLPNITLPLTSLPVFDIPIKPPIKSPISKSAQPAVVTPKSTSEPAKSFQSKLDYKFSDPIEEPDYVPSIFGLRPQIRFSSPLSAVPSEKVIKNDHLPDKITEAKSNGEKEPTSPVNKTLAVNFIPGKTALGGFQPKLKPISSEAKSPESNLKEVPEVLGSKPIFGGMNKLSAPAETPKEKPKPKESPKAKCKDCSTPISEEVDKCSRCSSATNKTEDKQPPPPTSGFGDMFKPPADTWECKECFVRNKLADLKCVACSTSKPGTAAQPQATRQTESIQVMPKSELNALFKKPEGSWECGVCLVQNKGDVLSCLACSTPKPGTTMTTEKSSESKPKFTFGIPQSDDSKKSGGFVFGTGLNSEAPKENFTFGDVGNSGATTGFKFGSLDPKAKRPEENKKPEDKNATTVVSEAPQVNSSTPAIKSSLVSSSGEEKDEKVVSKKRVSFGEPLVEEKSISETNSSTTGFGFGNSAPVPVEPVKTLFGNPPSTTSSSSVAATTASGGLLPSGFTFGAGSTLGNGIAKSLPFLSGSEQSNKKVFTFSAANPSPITTPTSSDEKAKFSSGDIFNDPSSSMEAKSQTPPGTEPTINNIFANNQSGKSLFSSGGDDKKVNFFATPTPAAGETKKSFFTENKNVFGGGGNSQPVEKWDNSVFGAAANKSSVFGGATVTTSSAASSGFPNFTSTTSFPSNNTTNSTPLFSFNSSATSGSAPSTGSSAAPPVLFSFKAERTAQQQQGGFSFPTLGGSSGTGQSSGFSFSAPQVTPQVPFSTFGAPATPAPTAFGASSAFGGSSTGTSTPAPFSFGAPQQQQQPAQQQQSTAQPAPVFTFGAQQSQPAKETSSGTPSFAFGSHSVSAPTPSFDPNIKPLFNFSGGATPTFS